MASNLMFPAGNKFHAKKIQYFSIFSHRLWMQLFIIGDTIFRQLLLQGLYNSCFVFISPFDITPYVLLTLWNLLPYTQCQVILVIVLSALYRRLDKLCSFEILAEKEHSCCGFVQSVYHIDHFTLVPCCHEWEHVLFVVISTLNTIPCRFI